MRAKRSALVMPVEFGNEPVGSMGPLRATFASSLGSNVFLQILPIAGSQKFRKVTLTVLLLVLNFSQGLQIAIDLQIGFINRLLMSLNGCTPPQT